MATKKNNYISADLDWAEKQLSTWRAYIDKHPIENLEDRKEWKELKSGAMMPVVVSTIEAQIKSIRETMKEYLTLLEVIKGLREKEDQKKIENRGKADLNPFETGDI